MKKGWTDYIPVTFEYKGVEFSCNSSILIGKDGKPSTVSIFDLKPVDPEVKKLAEQSALKTLETNSER